MEIKVNFLDKLRLEAKFDDFTVIADQPIRYKGDGSAPGPFDYFLASSALCAAYFVKLYCDTRNIPTDNIRLSQNNIVDPENRYQQTFKIQVELPAFAAGVVQDAVHFRNRENRRIEVQANCVFKDQNGFSTGDETPFQTVILTENSTEDLRFVSSNAQARKCTVRVRQAR